MSESAALSFPYAFAKRHGVLCEMTEDGLRVYHKQPLGLPLLAELQRYLGQSFDLKQLGSEEFDLRMAAHYEQGSSQAMAAVDDLGETLDLDLMATSMPEPEDLLEAQDDAPIIRLINAILSQAIKENASDVHIEPYENRMIVRLRVDGMLKEILQPPRHVAPLVISRIKVMAHLDIAEKRVPQDGRISLRIAGRAVDVRVSTLPSGFGERVVMRLLDKQAGRLDLERLGMAPATLKGMDKLIHRPHGIILVTGPTGSGKTTTLYAALSRLNSRTRNILTVEDPIEYYLDGIGQTQVNTKVDMSFARGLRAILRQDPDVVMVGEIRDLETAEIAVQASLTGHLVLSTLHTNSAVGAITRLRDMGVEPFLLASSLIGVVAQRLVRKINPQCRREYYPDEAERALLGIEEGVAIYQPVEDGNCFGKGYSGRTGLYEFVPVDGHMQTLIHSGAPEHELEAYARTLTPSMRQDGVRRVLAGETSLEEMLRVTQSE